MLKLPTLRKPEILRIFLVIIILGIFSGKFVFGAEYALLLGGLLLLVALSHKNLWLSVCALFLLANFYGQWRNFDKFETSELENFSNQTIEVAGEVVNFPDIREKDIRVFFKITKVNNQPLNKKEKVLLILSRDNNVLYGDKLVFKGKITTPRNFNEFNYREYLLRFDVKKIIKLPKEITKTCQQCGGTFLLRTASQLRDFLAKNLDKNLPIPHAQIAMGILLGVKHELPEFVQNNFRNSGLQHLLVVSGSNVTILIIFVSMFCKKLGRKINFIISTITLIFFVAMTGGDAPILRAALMGGIVGFSAVSGRFSESRNLVLLSVVIMGIINPSIIQADIGFFLSVMATLGIILGVPVLTKLCKNIPNSFEIKTLLIITISAQMAVLPILGIYFGNFPVAGFLSNLIAEPLIPLGMLFSFLLSVLGFLPTTLANFISIPAFVIIEILLQIAHLFGNFAGIKISLLTSYIFLIVWLSIGVWAIFSRWFENNFLRKNI